MSLKVAMRYAQSLVNICREYFILRKDFRLEE
jgi:hypothetical protein